VQSVTRSAAVVSIRVFSAPQIAVAAMAINADDNVFTDISGDELFDADATAVPFKGVT